MKTKSLLLTGIVTAFLLTGCRTTNNDTAAENEALKQQVAQLEQQITDLKQEGTTAAGDNTTAVVPENTTGNNNATSDTIYTLEELTTMVDDFVSKAEAATPGNDEAQNLEQFFALKQEENQIDHALDRHENSLEDQYRAGSLTREEYREKERELEKLEDRLDDAEDRLEINFGIDD